MTALDKSARIAGLLYLFITVTGVFNLMIVPGRLIVRGDPAATAARILASESLFRADVAIALLSSLGFLFLALALYQLFKGVHQPLAALMAILVVVQIPLSVVDAMVRLGVLELVRGGDYLAAMGAPQRDVLGMMLLRLLDHGTVASELYWGLWLCPLGALVLRSGFIPRLLGYWLIVNGIAYVVLCATGLLMPEHRREVYNVLFPIMLGEVAFTLWLLVFGARPRRGTASAAA